MKNFDLINRAVGKQKVVKTNSDKIPRQPRRFILIHTIAENELEELDWGKTSNLCGKWTINDDDDDYGNCGKLEGILV